MNRSEKKALNLQIMRLLQQYGSLNDLHAEICTDTAEAIQDSDIEALKCLKSLRSSVDHQIAHQLVLDYLKKKNMNHTLRCIESELKNNPKPEKLDIDIPETLGIDKSDNMINDAFQKYISNKEEIYTENQNALRDKIHQRLEQLDAPLQEASPSKPRRRKRSVKRDSRSGPQNRLNPSSDQASSDFDDI